MVTAKGVAAAAVGYAYLDAKHYLSEDNKKLRALLNVKFSCVSLSPTALASRPQGPIADEDIGLTGDALDLLLAIVKTKTRSTIRSKTPSNDSETLNATAAKASAGHGTRQ